MKRSFGAVGALVTVLVIAGCTPPPAPSPAVPAASVASASAGPDQAFPPTIASPGELDGTDVSVVVGTALAIAVDGGTEDKWSGTTADPSIAEFSAGGSDEGATFRPGFVAHKTGSTRATLRSPEGKEIAFTISVVAP